ncbi:MAG: hypothetical protein GC160_07035 [Acidobacteria bacterium]|nr:hypothetical protein [Acidobacteriota bacterium]
MRRDVLLLILLVLAIRLPFVGQPVQGDDAYYLLIAENARVDPAHAMQFGFRLQGETVWAAGHTRPPGDGYVLAALLTLLGGVREVPLHLFYTGFSLLAVLAMYWLARRFTGRAFEAALIFAATPALVVNGGKLESDVPMLAFWTLGAACFVHRRYLPAGASLAAAATFGYQLVFCLPVLALWAWREDRRSPAAWAALTTGPALLASWQLFERLSAGAAPAEALAGYASSYGLLALERKWRNLLALEAHLGWMASPLLLAAWLRDRRWALAAGAALAGAQALTLEGYSAVELAFFVASAGLGLALLLACVAEARRSWPAAWVAVFFAAAILLFYAGSARYLLPLAPAVALLLTGAVSSRALWFGAMAVQLALGLALAESERRYDEGYRLFAERLEPLVGSARLWSNAEWGLRYYLGRLGGEPLLRDQSVPAGAIVAESDLAGHINYGVEGSRQELLRLEAGPGPIPLRTIGRGSHAGYSSSDFGVLPFGLGGGPIDTVTAWLIGRPDPTVSYLRLGDPATDAHLLAGFFPSDGADWRWMGPRGSAVLLVPDGATRFELDLHIPDQAPARHVEVEIDGRIVASVDYDGTGGRLLEAPVELPPGPVRIVIRASPSYSPPGDGRELAIVVNGFGFR